jgi:cephalosporin hydroxylase
MATKEQVHLLLDKLGSIVLRLNMIRSAGKAVHISSQVRESHLQVVHVLRMLQSNHLKNSSNPDLD